MWKRSQIAKFFSGKFPAATNSIVEMHSASLDY
jgi:hypothetical protein